MNDIHGTGHSPEDQAMKLAKMAGQIETFFAHYPEEKAVALIADHINKFWSKKMRSDFVEAQRSNKIKISTLLSKTITIIK